MGLFHWALLVQQPGAKARILLLEIVTQTRPPPRALAPELAPSQTRRPGALCPRQRLFPLSGRFNAAALPAPASLLPPLRAFLPVAARTPFEGGSRGEARAERLGGVYLQVGAWWRQAKHQAPVAAGDQREAHTLTRALPAQHARTCKTICFRRSVSALPHAPKKKRTDAAEGASADSREVALELSSPPFSTAMLPPPGAGSTQPAHSSRAT